MKMRLAALALAAAFLISGCTVPPTPNTETAATTATTAATGTATVIAKTTTATAATTTVITTAPTTTASSVTRDNLIAHPAAWENIPAYSGEAFSVLQGGRPYFTAAEITATAFEYYSELDSLGRCGAALACCGKEIMPTDERGPIGNIKPSGWSQAKYDYVDGKYLYNRCHLIGWQLSGENANSQNLFTGTRYLNVEGMLPFENMVADYIKETDNHVMYRVTPWFLKDELLARGVQIEAYSVEDNGEGICLNVFCYNVQPRVTIHYANGHSAEATADPTTATTVAVSYILNTRSKKIHRPDCRSVAAISAANKQAYNGTVDELLKQGYTACGNCF